MEKDTEKGRKLKDSSTLDKSGMNVEYLREMRQNYLMIEADECQEKSYEVKMMMENSIEGLLKFRMKKMDNRCKFCYEITSKQPLSRLLETAAIGETEIRRLLLGVIQTLTRLEDYLLTEEQLLLDPDYIYVDSEGYQPFLCLIPGKKGNFPEEFNLLLQFLLDKVDHQDKEAVVLVYGLYRESLKENYGLDNLLKWFLKEDCPIVDSLSIEERCETINKEKIESWEKKETAEAQERELKHSQPDQGADVLKAKMWYPYFLPAVMMFVLAAGTGILSGKQGLVRYGSRMAMIGAGLLILGAIFCMYQLKGRQKNQLFQTPSYQYESHDQSSHNQQLPKDQEHYIQQSYNQTSSNRQNNIQPINHIFSQHIQNSKELLKTTVQSGQWQMIFDEPEEEPEEDSRLPESDQAEMHTVLLWNQEERKEGRSFISMDGGDDILLSYFPFIIGKQEGLCDYVIPRSTISRLHIRVDETEEGYMITDLNSTNGTYVNSRCLEANETVLIQPGDEVGIADLKFRLK